MLADELALYPDGQRAGLILWGRDGTIVWLKVYDFQPESSHRVPDVSYLCTWDDLGRRDLERASDASEPNDGCLARSSPIRNCRKIPIELVTQSLRVKWPGYASCRRQGFKSVSNASMTFCWERQLFAGFALLTIAFALTTSGCKQHPESRQVNSPPTFSTPACKHLSRINLIHLLRRLRDALQSCTATLTHRPTKPS